MTECTLRLSKWIFTYLEIPDRVVMIRLLTGKCWDLPANQFIEMCEKVLQEKKKAREVK